MSKAPLTGFHHASVTVTDLDRSAAWYESVFDLTELFDEHGDGRRAKVYRINGTHTMLGLVEHSTTGDDRFRPDRVGLDHLAFAVAERGHVDEWAIALEAANVDHSGPIELPVGAILNFHDPDGVQLSIFWEGVVS